MVFVLNKQKRPKDNCTPAKARILLRDGFAVVHKQHPFTIRLKDNAVHSQEKEYQIKVDPGSKTTGIALVDEDANAVFFAELEHRGERVVSLLETRRQTRRNRRTRELRYRKPKWGNTYKKKDSKFQADSPRPDDWLPPSIMSIEQNIVNFVKKLMALSNVRSIALESVKFDMQKMENANISGVEYQQGKLMGYEMRNYLLEETGQTCQYCRGASNDKRLEIEHMQPKSRGGSNRLSNLTIACHTCNRDKNSDSLPEYLKHLQSLNSSIAKTRTRHIERLLKTNKPFVPLRYAAWVNTMRHRLADDLRILVPHFTEGTGGQTHYNRIQQLKLPKEHYYDALAVAGLPPEGQFNIATDQVLEVKAFGRGSRFRGRTNACGIITKNLMREKQVHGFQTGDLVKAIVPKGKKKGVHVGRVAIRKSGYFNIRTDNGSVQGISHKHCSVLQRNDGYAYTLKKRSEGIRA